jgi:hypothetical protein
MSMTFVTGASTLHSPRAAANQVEMTLSRDFRLEKAKRFGVALRVPF